MKRYRITRQFTSAEMKLLSEIMGHGTGILLKEGEQERDEKKSHTGGMGLLLAMSIITTAEEIKDDA